MFLCVCVCACVRVETTKDLFLPRRTCNNNIFLLSLSLFLYLPHFNSLTSLSLPLLNVDVYYVDVQDLGSDFDHAQGVP